ncbi:hypothetical protein BS78_09G139900 [Paspalum vaginatum]|nr:hypothetical protein BS78_09G139900 [Paspalum vaginatum]
MIIESVEHTTADLTDIRLKLRKLSKYWERAVFERTAAEPPLLRRPSSTSARSPTGQFHADAPYGHRKLHRNWDLVRLFRELGPSPGQGCYSKRNMVGDGL